MERKFIVTEDGSKTLFLEEWGETYHSKFGALQEANFVFIQNGLDLFRAQSVSVLEIGFGTGLNAFVTLKQALEKGLKIEYTGVEAYPLTEAENKELNYVEASGWKELEADFNKILQCAWEEKVEINPLFTVEKQQKTFDTIVDEGLYDLIYFDAFGYQYQPELWSVDQFKKMFTALKPQGILVTYACRGVIKRAMQEAGFTTEKLPGPPGKREMLRATKNVI